MWEARRPRSGNVAPEHESPRALNGGGAQHLSKPRGPLEGRSSAGVGRTVESPADGNPRHVPTLDREIGEPLIEVFVQVGIVQSDVPAQKRTA